MKSGRVMQTAGIALAAGAIGAGVALLFAPQSGARTRACSGARPRMLATTFMKPTSA